MKQFKIACILLLSVSLMSAVTHKFYVSITKVEHSVENESLQIITKIFIDDIEKVLDTRYQTKTHLNTKKETPRDRELLKKYILDKLTISVNGKPVALDYLGIEYDIDLVKSYIEVKGVKTVNNIEIENNILFDGLDNQQNIIHLNINKYKRSLILDKDNPNGLLKF